MNPLLPMMTHVKFCWNWQMLLMYFMRLHQYISLKKDVALHITDLNIIYMYSIERCGKFDWNWPSGCGENCLISLMFIAILLVFPIEKSRSPSYEKRHLNDLRKLAKLGWGIDCLKNLRKTFLKKKLAGNSVIDIIKRDKAIHNNNAYIFKPTSWLIDWFDKILRRTGTISALWPRQIERRSKPTLIKR